MDINYELYKVFYYVATSLSFSEASKKLFISQSAVSQSIKTLEKKLGQTLFIRSTKKVQLTAAGALLLKHIEPAMNLIARGESQLLDSGTLGLGQLHIGAFGKILGHRIYVDNDQPDRKSYLRSCQPDTFGSIHRLIHIFNQLFQLRVRSIDLFGLLTNYGMPVKINR